MKITLILITILLITSCSQNNYEVPVDKPEPGLFSKDVSKGISLDSFLNKDSENQENFYVNSFLWRASIDVVSFAPFQSTDAFGGIIITEWYKRNNSEIKLSVFVKSRELRSEGIEVKAYIKNSKNQISEDKNLSTNVENLILTKARELRISNKIK